MTFLAFTEVHDTGKTKVWAVRNNNDGSYLGVIRWHGPWRKYVLDSEVVDPETMSRQKHAIPTIWSADCLQSVAAFILNQMDIRKWAQQEKQR